MQTGNINSSQYKKNSFLKQKIKLSLPFCSGLFYSQQIFSGQIFSTWPQLRILNTVASICSLFLMCFHNSPKVLVLPIPLKWKLPLTWILLFIIFNSQSITPNLGKDYSMLLYLKYSSNSKKSLYKTPFLLTKKPILGFPGGSVVKNLLANARDMGSISDPGRFHMPRNK